MTKENLPSETALGRRLHAGHEFLPPGVSAAFLARAVARELNRVEEVSGSDELSEVDANELLRLPAGSRGATRYHRFVFRVLSLAFSGSLRNGRIETPRFAGRKRIDITFDNGASHGFFAELKPKYGVNAPLVLCECKNYSSDPANPELDQLSGRLLRARLSFGMLICRNVKNRKDTTARCHDYLEKGEYLLALDDADVSEIIRCAARRDDVGVSGILHTRLGETLLG